MVLACTGVTGPTVPRRFNSLAQVTGEKPCWLVSRNSTVACGRS